MPQFTKQASPDELVIEGKEHVSARKAAELAGLTYNGLYNRILRGLCPTAIKHKPGKGYQAIWYFPVDGLPEGCMIARAPKALPNAEQVFPGLGRNADGVPCPQKLQKDLPAVNCSDCPHCADKSKKCYGLTRDAKVDEKGNTTYEYWWCHRIGRKVWPLKRWLEPAAPKPYTGPEIKTANDLPLPQARVTDARHEPKPVQIVAEKAAETPKPTAPELQNIEKAFGNFKNFLDTVIVKPSPSPLHQALLYLESQVASLDEEAAELEVALDSLADRAKKAHAAIEAIKAYEGMETEATR